MDGVKVVVSGCGTITEFQHLPALVQLQSQGLVTIAGLADPSPERLAICSKLTGKLATFANLQDALTALRPDYVVVCSPAAFHYEQTLSALRSGAHVLCEKPFALKSQDCEELIEEAQKLGRVLSVGFMRRFYPSVQTIRSVIKEQVLGAPRSFIIEEGSPFVWPVKSTHQFQRQFGGGVLADSGSHIFDFLLWWLGDLELLEYQDDALVGTEANCLIKLRAANGVTGTVRLSRETLLPNRYVIHCERGWVTFQYDSPDQMLWGWENAPAEARVTLADPNEGRYLWTAPDDSRRVPHSLISYFIAEHRNLIGAIRGEEEVLVSPEDAAKGIALIEQCYAAKRLLEMPWLDQTEAQRVQALSTRSQQ